MDDREKKLCPHCSKMHWISPRDRYLSCHENPEKVTFQGPWITWWEVLIIALWGLFLWIPALKDFFLTMPGFSLAPVVLYVNHKCHMKERTEPDEIFLIGIFGLFLCYCLGGLLLLAWTILTK